MADIDVKMQKGDTHACHRFGKPGCQIEILKINVHFVNKKNCQRIFDNKKSLKTEVMKNITLARA